MRPTAINLEVLGDIKMVVRPIVHASIFKRILDIIRIKIRHLKGENKWESSRRLNSNEVDIGGLKATN